MIMKVFKQLCEHSDGLACCRPLGGKAGIVSAGPGTYCGELLAQPAISSSAISNISAYLFKVLLPLL